MDSKGDRLLYRYPYQEQQQAQPQQLSQQPQSNASATDGSSSTTVTTITSTPTSTITSTTTTTITYTNELLLPNATVTQQQQQQQQQQQLQQHQQQQCTNILPVSSSTTTTTITLSAGGTGASASTSSLSNLTAITATTTPSAINDSNITLKRYNPYALTISDDIFQTTPQTTSKICIIKGKLQGLSDEVLSTLLAVKQQLCHQKFELKINDVRFVSHPTLIPRKERTNNNNFTSTAATTTDNNDLVINENDNNNNNNNNNKRNLDITESSNKIIAEINNNNDNINNNNIINALNENNDNNNNNNNDDNAQQQKIAPQQVLINVVFALHAQANYSIVKCYHELSKKLGLVLRVEEQRIGYLSEETLHMARTHDEVSTQQQPLERVFDLISERSSLAQAIKSIYHDLCTTGLISLTLNQTKTLAFCMPQKAHQLHKKGSLVDPNTIRSCLRSLKPYHGMLLLVDFAELLDCVPPPAIRMLLQLIEVYTPLLSLQNMASDADIGIENVYKIVSHLVYWAKATIIYPLCETNVYVIAPDAPLHTKSHLVDKFASRFAGMSLFEAIADFSLPTSIGHLTTPLQQPARQGILVQMVLWMLQHHLIIQLHTYVQFMTCPNDTYINQNQGSETRRLLENLQIDDINALSTAAVITSYNSAITMAAEPRNLLQPLSLLQLDNHSEHCNNVYSNGSRLNSCNLDDDDNDNNSNNIHNDIMEASSLLSMSSQPLPVPSHAVRHSLTETEAAYSAGGSTVSDNIAAMPSSSHKSNYSMTASVSTENCESIDSIEDEEKIKELLQIFDEIDCMAIRRIPASNNLDDLTLLVKLYQAGYFKSEHHLEEIMYFENLRRSQLLQLLDKFRDVLIIYETEDPAISSMYSNK